MQYGITTTASWGMENGQHTAQIVHSVVPKVFLVEEEPNVLNGVTIETFAATGWVRHGNNSIW